jgi:predicted transcriptional regulator of viral defense system
MESTPTNHRPDTIIITTQNKDKVSTSQLKTIFNYLQSHTATASMVADATGVPQKSICRYKRDLQKRGLLYEVKKGFCELTKFRAWYLTTNPDLFPKSNQLQLF